MCSVSGAKQNNRECLRCRAAKFTLDHLNRCKVPNSMCNYCDKKGHLEKVCNQKKSDSNQSFGKNRGFAKRVQLVDQEDTDNEDENYMVLNLEGNESNAKPYYMEGFLNGNRFKTMIDTSSPVTIYAIDCDAMMHVLKDSINLKYSELLTKVISKCNLIRKLIILEKTSFNISCNKLLRFILLLSHC